MQQLDYLLQNKVIHSKSSFIRDAVSRMAEEETQRFWDIQEAIKHLDANKKKRPAKG